MKESTKEEKELDDLIETVTRRCFGFGVDFVRSGSKNVDKKQRIEERNRISTLIKKNHIPRSKLLEVVGEDEKLDEALYANVDDRIRVSLENVNKNMLNSLKAEIREKIKKLSPQKK